jgi:leader peptidase (prepilin peptidase) / N-methyltransferase
MAISWRYPVIEATTAALYAAASARFGATPEFAVALVLLPALVSITAIDIQHQIIPDAITLPGIVAGVLANVATRHVSVIESLLGVVLGGGVFLVIILVSGGGMGGGDMKLGAMLGAFLGWKVALLALFFAVVTGGGLAIVLLAFGIRGRKDPVPFGPFLALGGAVALFAGEGLLRWYLSAFAG